MMNNVNKKIIIPNVSYPDSDMPVFRLPSSDQDSSAMNNLLDNLSLIESSLIVYLDDYTSYNEQNINKLRFLEPLLLDRPIYFVINHIFDMKSIAEVLPLVKNIFFRENSSDLKAFKEYLIKSDLKDLISKIETYTDDFRSKVLTVHNKANRFETISDDDQSFELE